MSHILHIPAAYQHVIMNITWYMADEVYLFVKELSQKYELELVLYDPQEDEVHDFRDVKHSINNNNKKKKWW